LGYSPKATSNQRLSKKNTPTNAPHSAKTKTTYEPLIKNPPSPKQIPKRHDVCPKDIPTVQHETSNISSSNQQSQGGTKQPASPREHQLAKNRRGPANKKDTMSEDNET